MYTSGPVGRPIYQTLSYQTYQKLISHVHQKKYYVGRGAENHSYISNMRNSYILYIIFTYVYTCIKNVVVDCLTDATRTTNHPVAPDKNHFNW